MEKKKKNIPQKGASKRLAEKLKKLGQQRPPQSLIDKINGDAKTKVASPTGRSSTEAET
ncbi:hypothetical protein K2X05_05285 [bacterium]|nr:hypothetical protein [bacterium]